MALDSVMSSDNTTRNQAENYLKQVHPYPMKQIYNKMILGSIL
jgi:hypothetical protein